MSTTVRMIKEVYFNFISDKSNPLYALIEQVDHLKDLGVKEIDGVYIIEGITDYRSLSTQAVMGLAQLGAEVIEYPTFIGIPEAKYEELVPETMPNSSITELDENDNEVTRKLKWSEYKDATHDHTLIDGKYYIEGDGQGGFISGADMLSLVVTGISVLSRPEYQDIQPDDGGE